MTYKLKDHVTDEMLVAVGFKKDRHGDLYRKTKSGRGEISIYRYNREIDENRYDRTTYGGFAYSNEYRHQVKSNIKDLIELGYVEEMK
jgi:hypothetical protein